MKCQENQGPHHGAMIWERLGVGNWPPCSLQEAPLHFQATEENRAGSFPPQQLPFSQPPATGIMASVKNSQRQCQEAQVEGQLGGSWSQRTGYKEEAWQEGGNMLALCNPAWVFHSMY